jgi:tetratricopeptide (TPR) repeat protein
MLLEGCSYTTTALHKCLALAKAARDRKWDLSASNEALFWFQLALTIDHHNVTALAGSARIYQYILSQPWWHNNQRVTNGAFARAIQLLRRANELDPDDAIVSATVGEVYSAVGKGEIADENFERAIALNPAYPPAHYFIHYNKLFLRPEVDVRPGIRKGIALAEQQQNQRQIAAAYYFSGFANTLYGEYGTAIRDLKKSLNMNPGYGSAHLALIAAAVLSKRSDTFRCIRTLRDRYPDFKSGTLDYMWLKRSRSDEYRHLVSPMLSAIKTKVLRN